MSDLSGWHAHQVHRYTDGPTACVAKPNVVKSIRREIERAGALSTADVRLASAMRLVRADTARRVGLNDGLFYPPGHARELAGARRAPLAAAALAPTPGVRKLHALALLVDFTDNAGTRPAADFERLLFDQTNPGSMASYYKTISGGQLDISGEAIGYLRMPRPYSFYTNGESGMGEASYFQSSSPVSGTSAYTPSGAVTYITPLTTIGMASEPGLPVRNVQASFSRSTLPAWIWRSIE